MHAHSVPPRPRLSPQRRSSGGAIGVGAKPPARSPRVGGSFSQQLPYQQQFQQQQFQQQHFQHQHQSPPPNRSVSFTSSYRSTLSSPPNTSTTTTAPRTAASMYGSFHGNLANTAAAIPRSNLSAHGTVNATPSIPPASSTSSSIASLTAHSPSPRPPSANSTGTTSPVSVSSEFNVSRPLRSIWICFGLVGNDSARLEGSTSTQEGLCNRCACLIRAAYEGPRQCVARIKEERRRERVHEAELDCMRRFQANKDGGELIRTHQEEIAKLRANIEDLIKQQTSLLQSEQKATALLELERRQNRVLEDSIRDLQRYIPAHVLGGITNRTPSPSAQRGTPTPPATKAMAVMMDAFSQTDTPAAPPPPATAPPSTPPPAPKPPAALSPSDVEASPGSGLKVRQLQVALEAERECNRTLQTKITTLLNEKQEVVKEKDELAEKLLKLEKPDSIPVNASTAAPAGLTNPEQTQKLIEERDQLSKEIDSLQKQLEAAKQETATLKAQSESARMEAMQTKLEKQIKDLKNELKVRCRESESVRMQYTAERDRRSVTLTKLNDQTRINQMLQAELDRLRDKASRVDTQAVQTESKPSANPTAAADFVLSLTDSSAGTAAPLPPPPSKPSPSSTVNTDPSGNNDPDAEGGVVLEVDEDELIVPTSTDDVPLNALNSSASSDSSQSSEDLTPWASSSNKQWSGGKSHKKEDNDVAPIASVF